MAYVHGIDQPKYADSKTPQVNAAILQTPERNLYLSDKFTSGTFVVFKTPWATR